MRRANYVIVEHECTAGRLVISDVGPWDEHPTVTNAVESVVEELAAAGHLQGGRRLFYYDSEGRLDEIVVERGEFSRFAPGPPGV